MSEDLRHLRFSSANCLESTHSPGFIFLPLPRSACVPPRIPPRAPARVSLARKKQAGPRFIPTSTTLVPARAKWEIPSCAIRRLPSNGEMMLYMRHFELAEYERINQDMLRAMAECGRVALKAKCNVSVGTPLSQFTSPRAVGKSTRL